jgi:hypothetical protein
VGFCENGNETSDCILNWFVLVVIITNMQEKPVDHKSEVFIVGVWKLLHVFAQKNHL